ncbi:carbohydrate binding domain-containing protein [uncultured Kocuria sp.]|uniref:carbohydrate binding domain-containing protein n=1 Tax=uncultured Kocuria sp. TaxID=259305 RepID=UPI0026291BDA|nr:carbohydrate binding domain-containing protein [uncultured Kocuria sp.]
MDDFEGYAGDDATLSAKYMHFDSSTIALTTTHTGSGDYGLAFSYDVGAFEYSGIGKAVGQDWSSCTAVELWMQGDGSSNAVTLQIVADGAYFEHRLDLDKTSGTMVVAPFANFVAAPWDTDHKGQSLDPTRLTHVTRCNLYIGKGGERTTGTVYCDDIRAV